MADNTTSQRKAQLDKAEREHLEDVVEKLRSRVEDNVRFQLTQKGLDDEPEDKDSLNADLDQLVEAIDLEGVDGHTWEEAFEKYIAGVGYTIVNRLAALRCMEVRDFIDEEVTVFKENGLTPAAETLVHEEFLLEDEAILEAYHNACDELAEETEILFDRESAYSLVDPDDDTSEELCGMLDEVPDEVWRADDVLGWVYEYYNRPVVEALDAKNTLEPDDVGPANQFYTPHWVVRMLADNSLGKLYLEATGQESSVPAAEELSIEERKERLVTPEDAPSVPELCTYLIPDEDDQDAPSFDHPSELRVIDPACGSGHFLLYAFDILERIWWAETDLDRSEIPAKILEHNLYGVDIDLRSCQLSAFNLYLKARTRAEEENGDFEMPNVGIVCADARVAEVEEAVDVLDEITGEGTDVREALDEIIGEFQTTEALGSLLDVQSTLSDEFMDQQTDIMEWGGEGPHTLNGFLRQLRKAVDERTSDSFGEQNLRSFLNLLVVLTQDYDVALMNPPYGSRGRMPNAVQNYVEAHYNYTTEYYINFFEACDRLSKDNGRIGMLVPRTFMFRRSFQEFREDFVGNRGSFDFLAEFGYGILDNATVGTAGTVVRSKVEGKDDRFGAFLRLHDKDASDKERTFVRDVLSNGESEIKRLYEVPLTEFSMIPGTPLTYSVPADIRKLHQTDCRLDPRASGIEFEGDRVSEVRTGIQTGDNARFIRYHWESKGSEDFRHFTKGGTEAWVLPQIALTLYWGVDGEEIKRHPSSVVRNESFYGQEGLTWTYIKRSGRRFGYFPKGGIFDQKGPMVFPNQMSAWTLLSVINSDVYHGLFLTLTPEREWNPSDVGRIPWQDFGENSDYLETLARQQFSHFAALRANDVNSPLYTSPPLLARSESTYFWNASVREAYPSDIDITSVTDRPPDVGFREQYRRFKQGQVEHENQIEKLAREIDSVVAEALEVSAEAMDELRSEIFLRTIEDESDRALSDPGSVTVDESELEEQIRLLVHHFAIEVIRDKDDGILPVDGGSGQPTMFDQVVERFQDAFGEHADDRLAEADSALGSAAATDEPYPNLRSFIAGELFHYHVKKMENTPILWKLTTSRLVSDSKGEGFACFVDYHQLDAGVFDRLQNRYLEPRKALLRERRSSANRRRGDDSLSASDKAAAAEEYARCGSGLEQIDIFEERLAELVQPSPREWSEENQQIAGEAIEKVTDFGERTASRLESLNELASLDDIDMEDLFSPSFYETVEKNQGGWLDALDTLESAFKSYSTDGSEPVEAHLYDLFEYYDDLIGSTHYASNGILFMTYYFGKFEDAGQAKIGDGGVSERERLLSELATGLDEYEELADEIADACDAVASDISSDWEDRAHSEITTSGYQPNHKHGVEINITPLAEAEIVPKTVEDDVL